MSLSLSLSSAVLLFFSLSLSLCLLSLPSPLSFPSLSADSPIRPFDNGFEFTESYCPDLRRYGVSGSWCFFVGLHSCDSLGGFLNITRDSNVLFSAEIKDVTSVTYSRDIGAGCTMTFQADPKTFRMTPTYINMCILASTRCPIVSTPPVNVWCSQVGEDCASLSSSCDSCVQTTSCGYCATTQTCLFDSFSVSPGGSPNPYCSNCSLSSYLQTPDECQLWREKQKNTQGGTPTNSRIGLGIGLALLFILIIGMAIWYWRRGKLKREFREQRGHIGMGRREGGGNSGQGYLNDVEDDRKSSTPIIVGDDNIGSGYVPPRLGGNVN